VSSTHITDDAVTDSAVVVTRVQRAVWLAPETGRVKCNVERRQWFFYPG
jgi:hypothetical protein